MRKDVIIDRVTIERKKEVFNAHTTHPASSDATNDMYYLFSIFPFRKEDPKNPSETSERKKSIVCCSVLLSSRASLVVVLIV
jgi:hypothetical protein